MPLFSDPIWREQVEAEKKAKGGRLAVRLHRQLQGVHGAKVGEKCGNCQLLVTHQYGGTYFKCSKARDTRSEASDWRKSWEACGLFQPMNRAS